jgi:hypothetical protein
VLKDSVRRVGRKILGRQTARRSKGAGPVAACDDIPLQSLWFASSTDGDVRVASELASNRVRREQVGYGADPSVGGEGEGGRGEIKEQWDKHG